ncbi:DUF3397 family protein [Nicoliella spurrieriana]|uniref:DUF3397 family protein n=1 Tax=Nicoliella spurrieriana TaxID=2925830 RepID=UPI003C6E22ED
MLGLGILLNIIFQILLLIIISIISIFIKSTFKFKIFNGFKPIDTLLPIWIYFTYSNTIDSSFYTFLPWVLIPFVLFAIIYISNAFFKHGDVNWFRTIKLIWRLGDICFPFVWIFSIFIK